MDFRDLDEFLDVKPFVLPIRGKDYAFPGEISAESWLRLHRITMQAQAGADAASVVMSDEEEAGLMAELFGDAMDELIADGCTSTEFKLIFLTLIAFHTHGEQVAELAWNARGEAPAPNREARRSEKPAKSNPVRGSRAGSSAKKRPAARRGQTSSRGGS